MTTPVQDFHQFGTASDWLHLALEAGKSVGWDWDVKSGIDSWFGDLETMFGIRAKTYSGTVEDFRERVHPQDRELVWKAVQHAMQTRELYTAQFRVVWRDGTIRWVAAQGKFYYSPDGEPERMMGIAQDITDRMSEKEALRESEERLRLAAHVGRMYAYEWDRATDIIVRSGEFMHILGLTVAPAVITCQEMLAVVYPDDRAKLVAATNSCTPENPACQVQYRVIRPDGSLVWLEKSARAFFDEKGTMLRMIGMVADISERHLAEEALSGVSRKLIEAQENERARISRELHDDIGQRLALLSVTLDRLKLLAANSNKRVHECLDDLRKQIFNIAGAVHVMSHELHSSTLRFLDLANAMRGFCAELSNQKNVEIRFSHKDVPGNLPQDISLCLFRVLQEGLHNAVKHSESRAFEVELNGQPGRLHLTVRDSGRGFDLETAMGGSGLGLSGMHERIKLVNGELVIHSQPERGTTIHARVPVAACHT
jgi:PAS domain S-box-containing protein